MPPPVGLSRARRRLFAVLLLAAVLAAAGWFALRPGPSRSTSVSTAAPSSAETSAVLQLLQRHAAALLDRDAAVWVADLDPASGGYASRQQAVFGNLAAVPLTTWRYVLSAPVTDPAVIGPAAARLGARVVVLHVQFDYALARVDPAPTAKDLWLTAVRRGADWKLAGDTDAAAVGGASWRGPWDFGPLLAETGPHTLVLSHPDHRADAATFGALVEHSVPVVTGVWGPDWNDHVAVLIPDTAAEFAAVSSDTADSHDLAAVAVADAVSADGTVLGARIVLNPTNLGRLDAAGRRLVVQHELTHIAARAHTSDQMSTWLIEGFADYVGNLGSGQAVATTASELASEVRAGKVPVALPTAADFDGADTRLPQVYEESWLACRLLAQRYGQPALVRFYRQVGAAAETDPTTAVAVGLRALRTTPAAFTAAWRNYLRAQLR